MNLKFIKNSIYLAIIIFAGWYGWYEYTKTPCDSLVEWDVGLFDERFGLSREQLVAAIERAEDPWESAAEKELFQYVPGADFKVNLVWSEEQEKLYEGNNLINALNNQQISIDTLQDEYDTIKRSYDRTIGRYEEQLAAYEKDVSYWNKQGGAPTDVYESLQKKSRSLDQQAQKIKILQQEVNALAEQNNLKINSYNAGVSEYNDLFTQGKEFDAGNTDGSEINIYSYDGNQELHTLLVHEFGHVIGLDHIDDPYSVMYYLLNPKNQNGELSLADLEGLRLSCEK